MKLAAGWGFRAQACEASFASCWQQLDVALRQSADFTMAVLDERLETPAYQQWLAWQSSAQPQAACRLFSQADLTGVKTPTQSARQLARFGTGSLCEALALLAAWDQSANASRQSFIATRIVAADRQATLAVVHTTTTGVPL